MMMLLSTLGNYKLHTNTHTHINKLLWAKVKAYACCGKEQPNNIANLPKYVVHSRGAIKPPALVLSHTYLFFILFWCFLHGAIPRLYIWKMFLHLVPHWICSVYRCFILDLAEYDGAYQITHALHNHTSHKYYRTILKSELR